MKNTYKLNVRGEEIVLTFSRINDSRRLSHWTVGTKKKPNLFQVQGAISCGIDLPPTLCPEWWQKAAASKNYSHGYRSHGIGFCSRKDTWSNLVGRHSALTEALDYLDHDSVLNAEIWAAYLEEERRRTKIKGPSSTPRTRKARPAAPRRPSLRQQMDQLMSLTQQMAARAGIPPEGLELPVRLWPERTEADAKPPYPQTLEDFAKWNDNLPVRPADSIELATEAEIKKLKQEVE